MPSAITGADIAVSTHSRPKAAGINHLSNLITRMFQHTAARSRLEVMFTNMHTVFCFNTQPPEGGWDKRKFNAHELTVSTHSRPKAAGDFIRAASMLSEVSTHSRPKAAGLSSWLI